MGGTVTLPLTLDQFYELWRKGTSKTLTDEQRAIIAPVVGPVWGTAGPGSGKSETLAARALRLLLAGDRQGLLPDPASIVITTFTTKAAENLKARLVDRLAAMGLSDAVDLSMLWIGTLHSLCDRIMRDYRFPAYQGLHLMDEVEQALFIYRNSDIRKESDLEFWQSWSTALPRRARNKLGAGYAPAGWEKTRAAITLFNRLAEDNLDEKVLASSNDPQVVKLFGYWKQYQEELLKFRRCDFGLVQKYFLEFLESSYGDTFLQGNRERSRPPLRHILVDEYQDTNPIQEAIYFRMARSMPSASLTVVGDDDQALYRFRGGTVEALVEFGKRCRAELGVSVQPLQLRANYRSHSDIVRFFNNYIERPEMTGGRAPGKKPMVPKASITGGPGVCVITGSTAVDAASSMADVIRELKDTNRILDWSEVAVLFRSTQETAQAAGKYVTALRNLGIPVYNPRSRKLLEAQEVRVALGALVALVDPELRVCSNPVRTLRSEVQGLASDWYQAFLGLSPHHPLRRWVETAATVDKMERRSGQPPTPVYRTLREEFYHILNHPPFAGVGTNAGWFDDPERNFRIGRVTALLEGYARSMGRAKADEETDQVKFVEGDLLVPSQTDSTRISTSWTENSFYRGLVEYLETFKANDPENDDTEIVRGRVQIMTVHQSKGLEFPYVFVVGLNEATNEDDSSLVLEDRLAPFRKRPVSLLPRTSRAAQDVIRYYYVAYSRAVQGLVLVDRKQNAREGELWFPK